MSPETLKQQASTSELIKNPVILVEKLDNLLKEPQNEQNKTEFKEWILKEWKGINETLLQSSDNRHYGNNGELIVKQIIPSPSIKDGASRHLIEYGPEFFKSFAGIDRLKVLMGFQSWVYSKNQYYMNIEFFADSNKRDDLLGLKIEHRELKRDEQRFEMLKEPTQIFEVRVSPSIEVHRIK